MRTRLAISALLAFIFLTGVAASSFTWLSYRVYAELTPGSWRSPTEILDRNGKTLVSLYGSEWRVAEPVILSRLPEHIPSAFLAAEDSRFRSHPGIDPIGVGRAAVTNIAAGGVAEGGSTLTQQLAKWRFLTADRTVSRKAVEAVLAVMIEVRLSKDEILEAYLNEVYLGHRDGREVRGLGEAARVYFGKTAEQLSVGEAAMMAGMIRAPNRDNPDERLRIARQRRDAVLGVMVDKKWITAAQENEAIASSAEFQPGERRPRPHPFLLAALRQEFIELVGERKLHTSGLRIHTSVDRQMQVAAEAAVRTGTQRLRAGHPWLRRKKPLQAAVLSVEPSTGGIRALVGGSDFKRSQFDRTRRMERQPGSAAKPFTYAAAIASGTVTPATIIDDSPVTITLASNRKWEPNNYDQQFRGPVTVREAFEKSLNVPAVRVATSVGVGRVRDVLERAGFSGELSETPAIALGVDDVTMRELVSAYSVFPNLGARSNPHIIEKIDKAGGGELYAYEHETTEALDPAVAYVMHSLMRGVVMRGTAASLNQSGLGHVAGKTGTTSNYRDAWFVGYVPDLLTAVWVGFDDGTPLRMSSGESAVPIWAAFMRGAPHARGEIAAPPGVSVIQVEAASGRVWREGCGPALTEVFLDGSEPRVPCGGAFDGSSIYAQFEEPGTLTEEQWAEWDRANAGMGNVQIVDDPDAVETTEPDLVTPPTPELDSADAAQRLEDERRLEEQRRRERDSLRAPPPVEVRPPPPPPVLPPPPPPVDPLPPPPPPPPPSQLEDSLRAAPASRR